MMRGKWFYGFPADFGHKDVASLTLALEGAYMYLKLRRRLEKSLGKGYRYITQRR
jgi:hypothetical protein